MNVYVGTYHKYNCGSLDGQWLNLDDYSDKGEFYVACHELHKDEDDPELMFQDFEAVSDWEDALYGESHISEDYWNIRAELSRLNISDEVFSAWVAIESSQISVDSVEQCLEQYQGQWDNLIDYVSDWYEETGDIQQVPEPLRGYIDYESIARDWQYGGDVSIQNGYVFSH